LPLAHTRDGFFPHNSSKHCILCSHDEESLEHLLKQCRVGKTVWQLFTTAPQPSMESLVCPPIQKRGNQHVVQQVIFIHAIYTLAHQRRFSSVTTLPPLDDADLSKIAAKMKIERRSFKPI
jgi:hypothetical protein